MGRTVVVRLRFDDYGRATRSHTLPEPTASTSRVLEVARGLLAEAGPLIAERGLTLLGLAVAGLADDRPQQLALPFGPRDDGELDAALDLLRDRYGAGSVTRATLLGRDHGPTVPLLPD